jgi:hypothetical protein
MTTTVTDGTRYPLAVVLARAVWFGTLAGFVAGAAVGTCLVPVVGTAFGAVYGAAIGAAFGLLNAPVMILVAVTCPRRWLVRSVGAASSAGWGWVAVAQYVHLGAVIAAAFTVACAIIGAALGTVVVFRPTDSSQPAGRPSASRRAGPIVLTALVVGGGVGAVGGVVVGLQAYEPTAAFAFLEGATFGAVVGAVAGVLIAGSDWLVRSSCHR